MLALAIWTALVPFLGFPGSWEEAFVTVSAALIALLSVDLHFLKRKKRPKRPKAKVAEVTDVYSESAPVRIPDERVES